MSPRRKIAVIGLGYVGLPVAVAFAREGFMVWASDIDCLACPGTGRTGSHARSRSKPDLNHPSLKFTRDADALGTSDFFIVTVPTPIDAARQPDLRAMFEASRLVGAALKKGDIVVYESRRFTPARRSKDCAPI